MTSLDATSIADLARRLREEGTSPSEEAASVVEDLAALYEMEKQKNHLLFDMIAELRDAINYLKERHV